MRHFPANAILKGLSLRGPDAADFLQRLTTANVVGLQVGEGVPAFFLTATGKVISFFWLWKVQENDFFFELFCAQQSGSTDLQRFQDHAEMMTFSEDIQWVEHKGSATLVFVEPSDPPLPKTSPDEMVWDHGNLVFGHRWWTQWGEFSMDASKTLSSEEFHRLRISGTGPAVPSEINPQTNPLEVGLLGGISQEKGCYPGQEVIEKILAKGAPAKRLIQLRGAGESPQPGESIQTEEKAIGTITSVVPTDSGYIALGLVQKGVANVGREFVINGDPASVVQVSSYQ